MSADDVLTGGCPGQSTGPTAISVAESSARCFSGATEGLSPEGSPKIGFFDDDGSLADDSCAEGFDAEGLLEAGFLVAGSAVNDFVADGFAAEGSPATGP